MPHSGAERRRLIALLLVAVLAAAVAVAALWLVMNLDGLRWLARANQWIADTLIRRLGYWGVFTLMFVESSLIPFPSEVVIPPAADLARRLPDWNLTAVILLGIAGSLGGALFNYALAQVLGRPLLLRAIMRFGHYLRISQQGYERAEAMFLRHGAVSTFTGRLIPGIRQIISLPAGLARMNLFAFCLLTSLGAGLWVVVLALLGYWFGANADLLDQMLREYSRWLLAGALVMIAAYSGIFLWRRGRGESPGSARKERPS